MNAISERPQRWLAAATSLLIVLAAASATEAQQAAASSARPTKAQLEQLVTPIALYPDTLVAQILTASQFPTQIVEADRFIQQNHSMTADQLSAAAAKQDWDPSVMALTRFPSVLGNMNQNLSWTSALGEAYYNDRKGVMQAVQTMRHRAYQAGTLKTTPQQTVTVQSGESGGTQTIIIQPSNPQVVYVPTYNPTVVYGAPTQVYPGYSSSDMMASALLGFGTGVAVGAVSASAWGCNWGGSSVTYNNNVYVAHNNVWGPNRWGPYNPYHPYNPYNPYHPYSPYNQYHPYNQNNPYNNPYNRQQYGQNNPNQYNRDNPNNPYNRNNPNNPYNRYQNNPNSQHPTTQGQASNRGYRNSGGQSWNRGQTGFSGYDQRADSGLGNRDAFGDFGRNGDSRMASDRGFSSLGGGFGNRSGGGFGGFDRGGGGGFGGFRGGRR